MSLRKWQNGLSLRPCPQAATTSNKAPVGALAAQDSPAEAASARPTAPLLYPYGKRVCACISQTLHSAPAYRCCSAHGRQARACPPHKTPPVLHAQSHVTPFPVSGGGAIAMLIRDEKGATDLAARGRRANNEDVLCSKVVAISLSRHHSHTFCPTWPVLPRL